MRATDENPVNALQASALLGVGQSYLSAIKRALGIRGRYFFLSQIRAFIRHNPSFTVSQIYPLKTATRPTRLTPRTPMNQTSSIPTTPPYLSAIEEQPESVTIPPAAGGAGELEAERTRSHPTSDQSVHWRKHLFAQKVKAVFGHWSASDVVQRSRRSPETVRRLRCGNPTKFSTLKEMAKDACIAREVWAELLTYWIKVVIGEDADLLCITTATGSADGAKARTTDPLSELFATLTIDEQEIILMLLQRRDVIACLPALMKLGSAKTPSHNSNRRRRANVEAMTCKPSPKSRSRQLLEQASSQDVWKAL